MTDHTAATVTRPAPGTYHIDPGRSTIHYSGKHLFGLGTVHATFALRRGDLTITDPVTRSVATVTVDASSFTSDKAKRDNDVRAAGLLDVATYPDITFTSDGLREEGAGWSVTGTVTAHGHSVPVTVLVDRVDAEGTGIRVHGRAAHLDRTTLGVTGSRGMVGRYLDLEVDAFAIPG
jgi:polyisoprenoid-binding protein YceI